MGLTPGPPTAAPVRAPTVAQEPPTRAPQRALRLPRPRRRRGFDLGQALLIAGAATPQLRQRIIERGLAVREREVVAGQSQDLARIKEIARTDPRAASQALDEYLSTTQLSAGALEALGDAQESIGVQQAVRQAIQTLPAQSRKAQVLRSALEEGNLTAESLPILMQTLQLIPDPIRTTVPGVGFVEIDPVTDESKLLVGEPFDPQTEEAKVFQDVINLQQQFGLKVGDPVIQSLSQRITRLRRGKALTSVAKSQQAIEDATFLYGAGSPQVQQLNQELQSLLNPTVQAKASDVIAIGTRFAAESKDFNTQAAGYAKVLALWNAPKPTGFSDVALVFAFMKLQDPDSVVREGEFATAEDTVGISERFVRMYNRAREGVRLTPAQRKDLFQTSRRVFAEAREKHLGIEKSFRTLSQSMNLDPKVVLRDYVGKFRDNLEPQLALDRTRIVRQFRGKANRNAVEGTIFSKDFEFEGMQ